MADPTWPSSPPEFNHLRLVGPGAGGTATTITNGAAWQTLAGCIELALSLSNLNTASTSLNFEGLGGLSSATTIGGLNTALELLAGWVQEKPPITASAVAAYEVAVSSMIPAEVSVANRTQQAADVQINPLVWGALTPAIIALDTAYFGEHWPQNASAGTAYGAALTALTSALAIPPPMATSGATTVTPTIPTGPAAHAADGADALGTQGEAALQSALQPLQAAMGAAQPAMGMFQQPLQQPMAALEGLSGLSQSVSEPLGLGGVPRGDTTEAGFGGSRNGAAGAGPTTGYPGAGLTSYTRPTSSFAGEPAGKPNSLKAGLLSTFELRGPTTSGTGAGIPLAPAPPGMLGSRKDDIHEGSVIRSPVVLRDDERPEMNQNDHSANRL